MLWPDAEMAEAAGKGGEEKRGFFPQGCFLCSPGVRPLSLSSSLDSGQRGCTGEPPFNRCEGPPDVRFRQAQHNPGLTQR
ncbi:MAG: hypothetical protein ABH852_02350 [Methanobacteriota archaeon]